jgi:beta-ribofuranosylaminobenzene 5'-phosphate synthase
MIEVSSRRFLRSVEVESPARLHLGFIDLSGVSGRRFGSLGLTLDGLSTRIFAEKSRTNSIQGPQSQRTLQYLEALQQRFSLPKGVKIVVKAAIPAHSGLGSGTQLALAVGSAISNLYDLNLSPREIAHLLDRGNRSGIGVAAFECGGFLVDGGRGLADAPPPIISRISFPTNWRILLFLDGRREGIHGDRENSAFQELPKFPANQVGHLSQLVMLNVLPSLQEADIDTFGKALSEIQCIVGDYFAPVQGGRFSSELVADVLSWVEPQGISCIGQSSWGPTGFAIVESEERAIRLLQAIQSRWSACSDLEVVILQGRNRGSEIAVTEDGRKNIKTDARYV